jgi:hypothetical protein
VPSKCVVIGETNPLPLAFRDNELPNCSVPLVWYSVCVGVQNPLHDLGAGMGPRGYWGTVVL